MALDCHTWLRATVMFLFVAFLPLAAAASDPDAPGCPLEGGGAIVNKSKEFAGDRHLFPVINYPEFGHSLVLANIKSNEMVVVGVMPEEGDQDARNTYATAAYEKLSDLSSKLFRPTLKGVAEQLTAAGYNAAVLPLPASMVHCLKADT